MLYSLLISFWFLGGILLLAGSIVFSTEEEMSRADPVWMVCGYILWPLMIIACIVSLRYPSLKWQISR